MKRVLLIVFASLIPGLAFGQTQTMVIQNGKVISGSTPMEISDEQKHMLEAAQHAVQGDFSGAERVYSQIISANSGNSDAYIQRAIVRRELKDMEGMNNDARSAITLLGSQPQTALTHYHKSQALRLLRQFDPARKELLVAIKQSGSNRWENDLQAIEMERRMARVQ